MVGERVAVMVEVRVDVVLMVAVLLGERVAVAEGDTVGLTVKVKV
ncbi:MAG: hypothetical protein N3C12_02970 [Candidatus Binatia bacterium]|nr:hypothetical protein [Candidatus Binatia bacterium]